MIYIIKGVSSRGSKPDAKKTVYFCGHSVRGVWSPDPEDATRFKSKQRADGVIVQLDYIGNDKSPEAVPL